MAQQLIALQAIVRYSGQIIWPKLETEIRGFSNLAEVNRFREHLIQGRKVVTIQQRLFIGITGPFRQPSLQTLFKGLIDQWHKPEPKRIALKLPTHQIAGLESQGLPHSLGDGDLALG